MTLRELLRDLVADEAARARFERDPAATLNDQGFAEVDPSLLGTALVHYADRADPAEFEQLRPLLERFGPLADPLHPDPGDGGLDHGDEVLDLELDLDLTTNVDDPGAVLDDLRAEDGPPSQVDDEAAPSFGTGSSDDGAGLVDQSGLTLRSATTTGGVVNRTADGSESPIDPTAHLDGLDDAATGLDLDGLDVPAAASSDTDDLDLDG